MLILRRLITFGLLLVSTTSLAGVNNITELDGSPSTYPYKIKFSNGSVTDNGDGSVTVTTSGGGGGGTLTSVGNCTTGACFDGTSGSDLTFDSAGGDGLLDYNGTRFNFSKPLDGTRIGVSSATDATFTALNATQGLNSTKIGNTSSADATFNTIIATRLEGTKIGGVTAADATFNTIIATRLEGTKIGGVTAADATFSTIIATRLEGTKIGGVSAADSTFTSVSIGANTLKSFPVSTSLGGTGSVAGFSLYSPIYSGTTSTGAFQSGTMGVSGNVLTSNGAGALPTFQASTGGGLATPVTTVNGGTGSAGGFTLNGPIFSGTTATGVFQSGSLAVEGRPLVSTGNGTPPAFRDYLTLQKGPLRDGWQAAIEIDANADNVNFPSIIFGNQTTTGYSEIQWTSSSSGSNGTNNFAQINVVPSSSTVANLSIYLNANTGTTNASQRMLMSGAGTTTFTGQLSNQIALTVKGVSSQSVDLQDWDDSSNNVLASVSSIGGIVGASLNSTKIGNTSTADATFNSVKFSGTMQGTSTGNIGWSVVAVANQACNTTCTSACVMGEDTSVLGSFVDCADATADRCICAGPS